VEWLVIRVRSAACDILDRCDSEARATMLAAYYGVHRRAGRYIVVARPL
jgi:hypothetical protein